MNLPSPKKLSKSHLMMTADMRGIKVKKRQKNTLFKKLKKNVKNTYNESPFKSIILDIRSILPKKGCKKIKKGLEYVEKMKELTFLQLENGKNNLIKLKNDLIEKFKKNIRTKKADRDYYEYEDNKFYGLKDVRNLFDQNDDDDGYEGIEYLFDESIMYYSFKNNGLEYEEIKKLLSVKSKKECIKYFITDGIIKQEEAIDYDVNYYRNNYRRCEKLQEYDYIRYKPCLISDFECIECKTIKKVEHYELINECCELIIHEMIEKIECNDDKKDECNDDKKDECNELIDDKKDECCELINIQEAEIIEDQMGQDVNMLKSSRNESNKIKELGLTMKELKAIVRKIGVKNYENLSRITLVEEIEQTDKKHWN